MSLQEDLTRLIADHGLVAVQSALNNILTKKEVVREEVGALLESKEVSTKSSTIVGQGWFGKIGAAADFEFYSRSSVGISKELAHTLAAKIRQSDSRLSHLCLRLPNTHTLYMIGRNDQPDAVGRPGYQVYFFEMEGACPPFPMFKQTALDMNKEISEKPRNRGQPVFDTGTKVTLKDDATLEKLHQAAILSNTDKNRIYGSIACNVGLMDSDWYRVNEEVFSHTAGMAWSLSDDYKYAEIMQVLSKDFGTNKPLIRSANDYEPNKKTIESLVQKLGDTDGRLELLVDTGMPADLCTQVVAAYLNNDFSALTVNHQVALQWLQNVLDEQAYVKVKTQIESV